MRPGHKLAPDRQFIRHHAKTQTRVFFRHTTQFKHYPASFYDTNPVVKVSFSFAHTNFRRPFSYRFIRENTYPQLSAFMQLPGKNHPHRFYLIVLQPSIGQSLEPELSESKVRTPRGYSPAIAFGYLPVFYSFRHQHSRSFKYSKTIPQPVPELFL
jgi:hypothetical protein